MTGSAAVYGNSLFLLAREEGLDQEILNQLKGVCGLIEENPEYVRLMGTPNLKKSERLAILGETFGAQVHEYLQNFLSILVENGTFAELPQCAAEYRRLYNEHHGILEATAVTAVPMETSLQEALKARLEKVTHKEIHLETRVESHMLGGVRLEMNGQWLDGTIRARLEGIKRDLLNAKA